jgi:hypothetical protein
MMGEKRSNGKKTVDLPVFCVCGSFAEVDGTL